MSVKSAPIVQNQPEFSFEEGRRIGWLKFPSVAAAITFHEKFAQKLSSYDSAPDPHDSHYGLGGQTFADYLATRCAAHALKLTQNAKARMQEPRTTFARPVAAITGGYWDTPSVQAGLPLAARRRVRTKLAPINLHFVTWYGSISDIAPVFPLAARLANAIHAYIMSGGPVTLRVTAIAEGDDPKFNKVASSVNVQTSSLAEIATALSPTFHRVTQIPLRQCMQNHGSLPRSSNFIPGARELLGPASALTAAFEKAISDLKID